MFILWVQAVAKKEQAMNQKRRSFLRRAAGVLLAPLGVGVGLKTTESPLSLYQLSLSPMRHIGERIQYNGRIYRVVSLDCLGWTRDVNGQLCKGYKYGATYLRRLRDE